MQEVGTRRGLINPPQSIPRAAAFARDLYGRAGDRPVRTKHASIALFRLEQHVAMAALVEKLARVGGHFQFFRKPTFGARQF